MHPFVRSRSTSNPRCTNSKSVLLGLKEYSKGAETNKLGAETDKIGAEMA